ncbi:MAG: SIR2 family protein [Zoogloeaceae bacterium]|nr:SIR2 family protein [Zoogloeaceae bacterium]
MQPDLRQQLIGGLKDGSIVPCLGYDILRDVTALADGRSIPADSDSLILAMNGGKPMSRRLMYEFPRAAMNVELKRGRRVVDTFLTRTYGETAWTRARLHDWLKEIRPPYVIDLNRDTQLQDSYADVAHTLVVGLARTGGTEYRFRLFEYRAGVHTEIAQEAADPALPVLFKPVGTPRPRPQYVASDADYVDYITELMGGFAIPAFLKSHRKGKRYLLLGLPLTRDTERMLLADILYDAATPVGWTLIPPSRASSTKERNFCERHHLEMIAADWEELLLA